MNQKIFTLKIIDYIKLVLIVLIALIISKCFCTSFFPNVTILTDSNYFSEKLNKTKNRQTKGG